MIGASSLLTTYTSLHLTFPRMDPYADPRDTLSREEAQEKLPSHLRQTGRTGSVLQGKLPTVSPKVYDQPHDSRLQVVQNRPPDLAANWKQQQPLPSRPLSSATSGSSTFYEDVPDAPAGSNDDEPAGSNDDAPAGSSNDFDAPPVKQVGI